MENATGHRSSAHATAKTLVRLSCALRQQRPGRERELLVE